MKALLRSINSMGTALSNPRWKNRGISITNNLSVLCACFVMLLVGVHTLTHGIGKIIFVGVVIIGSLLLIPFINQWGKVNTGRTLLTLVLVLGTLLITISNKMETGEMVSMSTFYNSRVAILFFSIFPFATIHFM